jgi:hypothetical protein
MKWFVVVCAVAVVLYALHRTALWLESRGWLYYKNRTPSSSALGNAFLEVQTIVDPGKRHQLEIQRQDAVEQDESGEPPPSERLDPPAIVDAERENTR